MQNRSRLLLSVVFLAFSLIISSSGVAQTVSKEYLQHKEHLDSLIELNRYGPAIEYTLTKTAIQNDSKHLFVLQRNRAYLKQRKPIADVEEECLESHIALRHSTDSLSIYLDARILELLGHYYYQTSNLFNGLSYLDSASQKYDLIQAYDRSIYNLNMIGSIYNINGEKAKSIQYYRRALRIFESHPADSSLYFELLIDLGNLHSNLQQNEKAEEYYNNVYENPLIRKYPEIQADVFVNLGNISQTDNRVQKAFFYYRKALETYTTLGDSVNQAVVLHNLAALSEDSSSTEAIKLYQRSLAIKQEISDYSGMGNSMFSIARIHYSEGRIVAAEQMANAALEASKKSQTLDNLSNIYKLLSIISAERSNWQEAYKYNLLYQDMSDSLLLISQQTAINRLEQIYDLEEQQRVIDNLNEAEKENQAMLQKSKVINYALTGATILLIIVLILLMSNFQQIQRTKGALYKKTLESTAAEALVNGQEQERQRLAHQLHDKVGNHITVLKNHLVAHQAGDEELMRIVQDMSAEVRNISQDLMPPVLERFGLADALEELCTRYRDQLKATIDLNIDQAENVPLNNDDQINLYRLIQELIQVSLFQYQANYLLIEMKWNTKGIWVHIEDNGVRKPRVNDEELVLQPWKSIEHRVQFLKGEFKRSSHNQGNEYSVHIPKE